MLALNEALRLHYFRAVLGVRGVRLGVDSGADVARKDVRLEGVHVGPCDENSFRPSSGSCLGKHEENKATMICCTCNRAVAGMSPNPEPKNWVLIRSEAYFTKTRTSRVK